jgi:hypothetical protein
MVNRPFRFVQASDFHLEQPPYGLTEVPDHLAEQLVEAPYRAAARVFDVALAEEVDFVLLAGNLVHPNRAGPRGLAFLAEQFARLSERGIEAYWAVGPADCRREWPPVIAWPEKVHIFSPHRVERFTHVRRGEPICQIAGCGIDGPPGPSPGEVIAASPGDFAPPTDDLFSLSVVPAQLDAAALTPLPVRYWALGGLANAATPLALSEPSRVAHCSGSPQGRCPAETGPHGCTVVHVDDQARIRLVPTATDVVRWHHERITINDAIGREPLERLLHARLQTLIAATPDRALMIRWTIAGAGPLLLHSRQSALAAELLAALRVEYGFQSPAAWTVSVDVEPPATLPQAWYEQQTLLGEFLRAVRSYEPPSADPPDLEPYLSERHLAGTLADRVTLAEPAVRASVLRQAALLGADLLRGDEPGPKGA